MYLNFSWRLLLFRKRVSNIWSSSLICLDRVWLVLNFFIPENLRCLYWRAVRYSTETSQNALYLLQPRSKYSSWLQVGRVSTTSRDFHCGWLSGTLDLSNWKEIYSGVRSTSMLPHRNRRNFNKIFNLKIKVKIFFMFKIFGNKIRRIRWNGAKFQNFGNNWNILNLGVY